MSTNERAMNNFVNGSLTLCADYVINGIIENIDLYEIKYLDQMEKTINNIQNSEIYIKAKNERLTSDEYDKLYGVYEKKKSILDNYIKKIKTNQPTFTEIKDKYSEYKKLMIELKDILSKNI